ncbi:TPA: hypothetical protein ACS72N_001440 [Providencia alcalifaciens]
MKKIMITALLALFLSGCDNSPPAPYGFKWGQSMEEVKALNLKGNCNIVTCTLTNTPDGTKGKTVLMFHDDLGLVQVLNSQETEKTSKQAIMNVFNRTGNELKSIYGDPVEKTTKVNDELDFIGCLEKIGCSEISEKYNKNGYQAYITVGVRQVDNKLAILTNFTKPID